MENTIGSSSYTLERILIAFPFHVLFFRILQYGSSGCKRASEQFSTQIA